MSSNGKSITIGCRTGASAALVLLTYVLAHCQTPVADPVVKAESAIILDAHSGKVLWSKNPDLALFPASTTKIMTALLLIERCGLDEVITAPADIETVKEASLHLKPGEQLKVRDMLYAILLRSANDACYAVAVHVGGSAPKFVEMMNTRAQAIGCTGTHFHNPNGLMDKEHKTTARDLALMGREAMKNPTFSGIVGQYKKQISRSVNWQDTIMVNHNKLLRADRTIDGIKTGYTKPAGNCFVGSCTRNGVRLITALLKSNRASWQNDQEALVRWGFANFRQTTAAAPQAALMPIKNHPAILVELREPLMMMAPKDSELVGKMRVLPLPLPASGVVHVGDEIGRWEYEDSTGFVATAPAYSMRTLVIDDRQSSQVPRRGVSFVLFACTLGGLGYAFRRKAWLIKR